MNPLIKEKLCTYTPVYENIYEFKTQVWRDTCFNAKALFPEERLGGYRCPGYCVVFCGCPFLGPAHFTQLREMLPIAGLYRVPLQTVPSAASSFLAKLKVPPWERDCIQWLALIWVKCMCPLLQFGTVMKGNPSFRAPQGWLQPLLQPATTWQPVFCFILLLSSPPRCFWEYFPITCTQVSLRVYMLGILSLQQWAIHYWLVEGRWVFFSLFCLLLKLE